MFGTNSGRAGPWLDQYAAQAGYSGGVGFAAAARHRGTDLVTSLGDGGDRDGWTGDGVHGRRWCRGNQPCARQHGIDQT
ncbi:hypothetical protein [Nocardia sp. NPDC004750]